MESMRMRFGRTVPSQVALFLMTLALLLTARITTAQDDSSTAANKINSIAAKGGPGAPVIQIDTETPIGYRYTVYDSYDPVRIVVDLPNVDTSGVKNIIKVGNGPLREIRISNFDLASGKLGRIELLLTREAKYKVASDGKTFSVSFAESAGDLMPVTTEATVSAASGAAEPGQSAPEGVKDSAVAAKSIKAIRHSERKAEIVFDGGSVNYQYFRLRTPPRLVVDLYGVKPEFKERLYKLANGFSQMRVGDTAEKTRLVLDAGQSLPTHNVAMEGSVLVITWEAGKAAAEAPAAVQVAPAERSEAKLVKKAVVMKEAAAPPAPAPAASDSQSAKPAIPAAATKTKERDEAKGTAVAVEAIDFKVEDGRSLLTISLSGPAEVTDPVVEKDLVRFGIKNATISRALRRTIDASSFPSAVKRVFPYLAEGGKEVRFLSELKGAVPHSLQQAKGKVVFVVENDRFAEPPPQPGKIVIPIASAAPRSVTAEKDVADKPAPEKAAPQASASVWAVKALPEEAVAVKAVAATTPTPAPAVRNEQIIAKPAGAEEIDGFTGEKISLVFDDANIRNILQLIGEVSNLNIIAGEDVKGTITLRLIDVPWDQALSLILESKGLGMLREGNVVRIMPKEQIRALRQAEMTAVKEEKQLEEVVTEVVPINYTALGNITAPAKELLTDRGKITEDARNKQIIVTDIPSAIDSIKKLAAILDTPERQVMIEARIVEASSSFGRDLGVKWGISYNNNDASSGGVNNASLGLGGSFLIAPPAAGSVMGNAGLGSGITFGRVGIDSTVLDLRISALESAGYGKVISTPRVSTLNGGTASISQGTKIPYQSTGDDGKAKTEFVDANLSLTVQPVINPDDSIILDITATNSSIGSTVSTGAGTAPAIDTKEAKTKVIVRNGETTVIGGIFVETENASNAGVPLLMKVPIIGHLFRSDSKTTSRSELLVFITPRIVQ